MMDKIFFGFAISFMSLICLSGAALVINAMIYGG